MSRPVSADVRASHSAAIHCVRLEDRTVPALAAADVGGLFDAEYYLVSNPDVLAARVDPLDHFVTRGQFENRSGGLPFFDPASYLALNPDLVAVGTGGMNLAEHFVKVGQFENRNPGPLFDADFYLAENADVAPLAPTFTAYSHFVRFGQFEGRDGSPEIDTQGYLAENADVAAVTSGRMTAAKHVALFGQYENRDPSASFDAGSYLAENLDVAAAVGPRPGLSALGHFVIFGQIEGRDSGPFDPADDLSAAPDLGTPDGSERPVTAAPGSAGQLLRFTVSAPSVVTGRVTGLTGAANVQLIRNIGGDKAAEVDDVIDRATGSADSPAVLSDVLQAGTYYLRVSAAAGATSAVTGSLSVVSRTFTETASAGSLLGAVSGTPLTASGTLAASGPPRVYVFTVAERQAVTATVSGAANALLNLLSSPGDGQLQSLIKAGPRPGGDVSASQVLTAGLYFVVLASANETPFTLTLTGAAAPPPVVQPPSAPGQPALVLDPRHGYGLARVDRALRLALGLGEVPAAPDLTSADGTNFGDLNLMGVSAAWNRGITGQGVIVAVIDSGVNPTHFELNGRLPANLGRDFLTGGEAGVAGFSDENGHGSHVAGTIGAARNRSGITGVAYGATIMALKVFDKSGSTTNTAGVTNAINYAVANGAKVINLSLGGDTADPDQAAAIRNAYAKGVVVIAASGNESKPTPGFPARDANATPASLVSVGAVNRSRVVAGFSNGALADPSILSFVVAPGVDVLSLAPTGDGFLSQQGTSMATPHVAGLAALLLQANPNLTPAEVISIINRSADPTGLTANAFGSD